MDDALLINEASAHRVVRSITDAVVRNLMNFAVGEARMRVLRRVGQSEVEWRLSLPEAPFDMGFFVAVLMPMFSQTDAIKAVLEGKSLAEAVGWDIGDHISDMSSQGEV